MIRLSKLALLWGLLLILPAQAPQIDIAARVDGVVGAWMRDRHIAEAEVAVADEGKLLGSFGHGWKAKDKRPVASLSKLITGLCAANLVDQNRLHLQDELGKVLGPALMIPKDPRFAHITIEQLLTHRAGLTKNAFDDAHDKSIRDAFATAALTPLDNDPGITVAYSDSGYLILGYVIETITKKRYDQACASVFSNAGLAANAGVIDPTLAARAPNGGWSIDAEDYARLLSSLDHFGRTSQAWLRKLTDGTAYVKGGPCSRFGPHASYGFGFCRQQASSGRQRYYHDGLLHFHPPFYTKKGGSFFYVNEEGVAAVVIFSGENGGDAYKALEAGVMAVMPAQ